MRGLTTIMCTLAIVFTFSISTASAHIWFDFEGTTLNPVTNNGSTTEIENYMTEVYSSTVKAYNVRANDGVSGPGSTSWPGTGASLNPASQSGFYASMSFAGQPYHFLFLNEPISAVQFDMAVFDDGTDTIGGYDFELLAYGTDYGNRWVPAPSSLVGTHSWSDTGPFSGNSGLINFLEPVSMLVMSDTGTWDVGVDNMHVISVADGNGTEVPVPGAMLLAVIGLGMVGWIKRRLD